MQLWYKSWCWIFKIHCSYVHGVNSIFTIICVVLICSYIKYTAVLYENRAYQVFSGHLGEKKNHFKCSFTFEHFLIENQIVEIHIEPLKLLPLGHPKNKIINNFLLSDN